MNTRTCKQCGWVFPGSYTMTACKFCKTRFDVQICASCHKLTPTAEFLVRKTGRNAGYLDRNCRSCKSALNGLFPEQAAVRAKRFIENKRKSLGEQYAKWLDLSKIEFKPMTQEQWIDVCAHFGGCAICDNEHIEAREYFVPFKEGGKYAPWNMFPLCGACAPKVRITSNPFVYFDTRLNGSSQHCMSKDKMQRLLEYFVMQIERSKDANDRSNKDAT